MTTSLALDSRVMIRRSVLLSARNVEALLTSVMLPVILMLLFVYVFGGAISTDGAYVNYVVPGIILLCAAYGAASTAVSVAGDMTNGIIDRFRSMPVASSALLTGHVTASLARNLMATTLVVGVAFAVGWRPDATAVEWFAAVGIVVLFIAAISWLSAAFGLLARSAEAANGFTFILLFLPYVSSAFVPTGTMPAALRGFARHQPVTPVIETLRGLWMGTSIGSQVWWALAWSLGIGVISYAAATWLFRRRTK